MKDNTELVTCIIYTYNKFDDILYTIQSVLDQTYSKIELIISDDASDNMPKAEVEKYIINHKKENIIKYQIIQHKENVGTVKNGINAVTVASGKYIIQLAGDDCFYSNNVIEKVIHTMQKNKWDHILCRRMACSDFNTIKGMLPSDRELQEIGKLNTAYKQKMALVCNKSYHMASGAGFYFSKDFYSEMGGYDEQYCLLEDLPFFYKMLKKNISLNTCFDIIAVLYQLGGVSTTPSRPATLLNDIANFYKTIWEQDNMEFPPSVRRVVYVTYIFKCEFTKMKLFKKIIFILCYLDVFLGKAVSRVLCRNFSL